MALFLVANARNGDLFVRAMAGYKRFFFGDLVYWQSGGELL
jgi:hypothetical protein